MRRAAILCLAPLLLAASEAPRQPRMLDPMDDPAAWPAQGSDGVIATSTAVDGAIRLTYDFGRVSGYAFLRRALPVALPRNYELRFRVRGTGGRNDLQVKLTDASGDNVWWHVLRDFRPAADWQEIAIGAGDIAFAWGPTTDKVLRRAAAVEFVVARNRDGGAGAIEIDELRLVPLPGDPVAATAADNPLNDTLAALAKTGPRGEFPRAYVGEQPYWTLAGSDGGAAAALISEDGAIEPAKGSYSVEPFVFGDGRRFSWADVTARQSLADNDLPIPSVTWTGPGFTLVTTLLTAHDAGQVLAGYRLTNTGKTRRRLTLALAVRPLQVNPPAQFLSQRGGASPIKSLTARGRTLTVVQTPDEGDPPIVRSLTFGETPKRVVMTTTGRLPSPLARPVAAITTATGLATGLATFDADLRPGESRFVPIGFGAGPVAWDRTHVATRSYWRRTLDRVTITVPPAKQAVADTVRTSLAHILMSRAGPMLKPGTRSYDRAWIRDGAMISEGLLRLGQPAVARDFANWYRGHLFPNGKVPCCVDFRGADPVPENDSQGEYIFLATELFRYTGDRAALARDWPAILGAARYMDQLRRSERTSGNLTDQTRMRYGLMPPSISHEGYSAKAQYSLWDDFWALRGYKDAAAVATLLGKSEAGEVAASRDQFAADLHAAIRYAAQYWKIDYIPGATSLGDFDATSTTIGLDPGGEQARLPKALLTNTFELYWQRVLARRNGTVAWQDYTPYELRNVSAFVRLGWRDRVDPLLDGFLQDRRPGAWNGWAEVVGRNPREIRFIGDMPHAWISSDFIRAVLDMFAYEDRDTGALVLGAGLGPAWLTGAGSAIRALQTPYGALDVAMRGDAARLQVTIAGNAAPPGGFVLPWPFAGSPPPALVDGKPAVWVDGRLTVRFTGRPIQIVVQK